MRNQKQLNIQFVINIAAAQIILFGSNLFMHLI